MFAVEIAAAEAPLVLALDIGTSSVRALLFDAQARQVRIPVARRETRLHVSQDGASELEPDHLLTSLWACVDECCQAAGSQVNRIGGVAISTFVSNLLGMDANGRAVTPLMTYADTRPSLDALHLRNRLDEAALHDRTGTHIHPSYLPARFMWIRRAHPEWLSLVRHWISIGEYLAWQLFGSLAVSFSVASWTGLLERRLLTWDDELLGALALDGLNLSVLVDVDQPWRGLRPEFARRWPALRNVPWFPAVGDGAAANIGSGCHAAGRLALTVGTSSALRVVTTEPVERVPEGLWCYRVDRQRALLGGAMSEGGNIYAWLCQTLNLEGIADLEQALAELPPAGPDLVFLPLLLGERSPGWQGQLRGALNGLSLATTPLEILRAGLEGVAARLALIYHLLHPALSAEPEVIASGGALLNSPAWLQIIADTLGRPVTTWQTEEATARGAALLALQSMGVFPDLASAPELSDTIVQPDAGRHQIYLLAGRRLQELYGAVCGLQP
jgi:gluconokinase